MLVYSLRARTTKAKFLGPPGASNSVSDSQCWSQSESLDRGSFGTCGGFRPDTLEHTVLALPQCYTACSTKAQALASLRPPSKARSPLRCPASCRCRFTRVFESTPRHNMHPLCTNFVVKRYTSLWVILTCDRPVLRPHSDSCVIADNGQDKTTDTVCVV